MHQRQVQKPNGCAALFYLGLLILGAAVVLGLAVRVFLWIVGG